MLYYTCAQRGVLKMLMSFIQYLKDTKAELSHVSWPSKRQTAIYTALVIVVSFFTAIYLGVFDYLFTNILTKIVS